MVDRGRRGARQKQEHRFYESRFSGLGVWDLALVLRPGVRNPDEIYKSSSKILSSVKKNISCNKVDPNDTW